MGRYEANDTTVTERKLPIVLVSGDFIERFTPMKERVVRDRIWFMNSRKRIEVRTNRNASRDG